MHFTYNKMHRSSMFCSMSFDSCILLWNHHPKHHIEHFITPENSHECLTWQITAPTKAIVPSGFKHHRMCLVWV